MISTSGNDQQPQAGPWEFAGRGKSELMRDLDGMPVSTAVAPNIQ